MTGRAPVGSIPPAPKPSSKKRLPFPLWFALPLVLLALLAAGCPAPLPSGPPDTQIRWICDQKADQAMQSGDYEAAIRLHKKFLEKEPANALAAYHLGYAYGLVGNHELEIINYEKAMHDGLVNEQITFNLGMAYGESGQFRKALQTFQKGLEIDPDSLDNRFGLALTYLNRGNGSKAVGYLKDILKIDPSHALAKEWLARIEKGGDN